MDDTCCIRIDKTSNIELPEAINLRFVWYSLRTRVQYIQQASRATATCGVHVPGPDSAFIPRAMALTRADAPRAHDVNLRIMKQLFNSSLFAWDDWVTSDNTIPLG